MTSLKKDGTVFKDASRVGSGRRRDCGAEAGTLALALTAGFLALSSLPAYALKPDEAQAVYSEEIGRAHV